MLKSIAVQNPLTSNPLITDDAKRINSALITKVNSPSVKMLIGKVRIIKIGLIITLTTPKNKASHSAAQKPLMATPGIK